MLKALLWKEWRETRLFFFLMALIVPIHSLLLNNIDYERSVKADAFGVLYILTWIFFAIFMAANQFASERESGTLSFLMSRPIHWINIWLFKVVYGTIFLILYGIFLLLMSLIFISPLLESVPLLETLLPHSGNYTTNANFSWLLLYTSILGIYFISCIVSINIKSSFKAALMTLLISGCLLFIMLCSSSALYFKASHYLFWIIFPILIFIIFIKYQPKSYLIRITYWVLPFGGILIWVVVSLRGGSLWVLLNNTLNYRGSIIDASYIFFSPVSFSICLSGISTSLFAFGILRREYPGWWKSLSCWNFLAVLAICFSAFLVLIIPKEKEIGLGSDSYYWWQDRNNQSLTLIFEDIYYINIKNRSEALGIGVSDKYLLLNMENGKARFYGRENFFPGGFQSISEDNRWAMYTCPTLKWGIYYKWGLWAEDLDTSEQYLLMTMDNKQSITGEWFDEGKRLLIHNLHNWPYRYSNQLHSKQSLLLFSVADGEPKKIGKMQIPNSSNLIHIDKKDRLYFYDYRKRLVSCYNRDLIKEYDIDLIQEKFTELNPGFEQRISWRFSDTEPKISLDGEYMIFSVRGYSKKQENDSKNQISRVKREVWCVSLPDGASKKLDDIEFDDNYYIWWDSIPWHPFADNFLVGTHISESGYQETRLIDLKSGTTKTLLKEESDDRSRIINLKWSGNGKYFLTNSYYRDPYTVNQGERTVRLFEFDLKTLSSRIVSTKTTLKWNYYDSPLWSPERSQVIFRSEIDKEIWRLDLIAGKWSKIICPFDDYILLGINNGGEVFVAPERKARIYRLTEKQTEIIYQGE